MKKVFYLVFITFIVSSSFGFYRGCGFLQYLTFSVLGHRSNILISYLEHGGTQIHQFAVGKNGAIFTSIGRDENVWSKSVSGTTQDLNFVRTNSSFLIPIACAVGDSGTVLVSNDKGISWVDHSIPGLTANLYSFDFLYTQVPFINFIVCGDNGVVYKSSNNNGVYSWQQIITNTTEQLNTIGAITQDLYIVAGENGKILKTNDGGLNWLDLGLADSTADFNRLFLGISVNAYGYVWLVGDNGKIYMSTDYGYEWSIRESGTIENLYDVVFKNELEGVVVGANGVVRYTSDGGNTWQEDTYLSGITSGDIVCITGVDPNTAGAIIKSHNFQKLAGTDTTYLVTVSSEPLVGVDDEENTTLTQYRLEQNYPNPFNPTTKIRYTIPSNISAEGKNHNTKLIVYDVLGNEIATLVDEYKTAGSYEVDFKQMDISTGIYFYKLTAGNFSETKKMILLK
ncbi:MAG: T9SS type A sorting domain-containing protein [Ignavibacteriaceae bacterium]